MRKSWGNDVEFWEFVCRGTQDIWINFQKAQGRHQYLSK